MGLANERWERYEIGRILIKMSFYSYVGFPSVPKTLKYTELLTKFQYLDMEVLRQVHRLPKNVFGVINIKH
jgi:hypothetical protein